MTPNLNEKWLLAKHPREVNSGCILLAGKLIDYASKDVFSCKIVLNTTEETSVGSILRLAMIAEASGHLVARKVTK